MGEYHNDPEALDRVAQLLEAGRAPEQPADDEEEHEEATETAPREAPEGVQDDDAETAETDAHDDEENEDEEAQDGPERLTLEALAEKAGVSVADVYELLDVPMGDGVEPLSLAALKDGYRDAARLDDDRVGLEEQREQWAQERNQRELADLRNRREAEALLGVLDHAQIPPQLIEQVRRAHQDHERAEWNRLMDVRPEFRDQATLKQRQQRWERLLLERGFSLAEVNSVVDHRTALMVDDFCVALDYIETLKKRVDEEREKARAKARKRKRGARPAVNGDARPRAQTTAQREADISRRVHALVNQGSS